VLETGHSYSKGVSVKIIQEKLKHLINIKTLNINTKHVDQNVSLGVGHVIVAHLACRSPVASLGLVSSGQQLMGVSLFFLEINLTTFLVIAPESD